MLRVVRLPEATVEPAPVSLDTSYALDDCLRRNGWIAFCPNFEAWGVWLPLGDPPFLIARDTWTICAGRDSQTVWLRARHEPILTEYDGVARSARRELELPGQLKVESSQPVGEVRSGLLFGLGGDGGLFAWKPPAEPQILLDGVTPVALDPTGRTVLSWRHAARELVLYDVERRRQTVLEEPDGGRWPLFNAAFSPDGAWLAVDLDYSIEYSEEELSAQLQEVARGRATYEPQTHRLGVVRCSDGAMTVAEGKYDNFANLVWSLDSKWIVFSTPFAPRALWVTTPAEARLARIRFKQNAPSLLCDISDLAS
jgi:hypothetical protein